MENKAETQKNRKINENEFNSTTRSYYKTVPLDEAGNIF